MPGRIPIRRFTSWFRRPANGNFPLRSASWWTAAIRERTRPSSFTTPGPNMRCRSRGTPTARLPCRRTRFSSVTTRSSSRLSPRNSTILRTPRSSTATASGNGARVTAWPTTRTTCRPLTRIRRRSSARCSTGSRSSMPSISRRFPLLSTTTACWDIPRARARPIRTARVWSPCPWPTAIACVTTPSA